MRAVGDKIWVEIKDVPSITLFTQIIEIGPPLAPNVSNDMQQYIVLYSVGWSYRGKNTQHTLANAWWIYEKDIVSSDPNWNHVVNQLVTVPSQPTTSVEPATQSVDSAPELTKSKHEEAIDEILKETEEKIKQEQVILERAEEKKPDNFTGVFCYLCNRFIHKDNATYVGELNFICNRCKG